MRNRLKFFTQAESQPLAVWIQTLFLAIGIIYGVIQINYLSTNYDISMNQRYMEYYEIYSKDIYSRTDELSKFYLQVKDVESSETISKDVLNEVFQKELKVWKFFRRLSKCAELGLCSEVKSSSLICTDAKFLNKQVKDALPVLVEIDKNRFENISWRYQYLLRSQCSLVDQAFYYIGWDV